MTFKTIGLCLLIISVYWVGRRSVKKLIRQWGAQRGVARSRIDYVNAAVQLFMSAITLIAIGMVVGLGYRDVGLFFGSVFAVVGVALFAQWSIVSNVTASVIVFFFFPYKVGDYVRILDGDNTIEGRLKEITLFHVILSAEDGMLSTFPNSLVFQKAVQINSQYDSKRIQKEQTKTENKVGENV